MKDKISRIQFRKVKLVAYGVTFGLLSYLVLNSAFAEPNKITVAKPPAPIALVSTTTDPGKVTFTWTMPGIERQADGFYVIRDGITIGQTTSTSYTDETTQPGTTYSYAVSAYNSGGASPSSSAVSIKVPLPAVSAHDTTPPSAPTSMNLVVDSAKQINLSWNKSSDNLAVSHYEVFRNGQKIAQVDSTSLGDTTILPSTNYTYWVVAVDPAGNVSNNSNKATITSPARKE